MHSQLTDYCPECEIQVDTVAHFKHCKVDKVPNYVELQPDKHLGSATNVNILIGNFELDADYKKSLINTIECYEKQVKKLKPN